jgi:hypothetical protein
MKKFKKKKKKKKKKKAKRRGWFGPWGGSATPKEKKGIAEPPLFGLR